MGCGGVQYKKAEELQLTQEEILEAASGGNLDKVKQILNKKPNLINARNKDGDTPLHYAAWPFSDGFLAIFGKYPETVSFLLSSGADVNAKNDMDIMPIHYAAYYQGSTKIKSEVNGRQVQHWEIANEIIRLLIEAGADINAKAAADKDMTPLHYASYHGMKETVEFLVKMGADINAQLKENNKKVRTPLDVARLYKRPEVIEFLEKNGAKNGDEL